MKDWYSYLDFEISAEWMAAKWLYYYNLQYCMFDTEDL